MIIKKHYFLCLLTFCFFHLSWAVDDGKHIIVIDPGHTKNQPGAVGILGRSEVSYNDEFAFELGSQLKESGFIAIQTREKDQSIGLAERADVSNKAHPVIFLSIHHDSAQLRYLEKTSTSNGLSGYGTIKPITGFSIFISRLNAEYSSSLLFAEALGQSLIKLGRHPALHHAENIEGENRELINREFGIYRFDDLVVLKNNRSPAVLLEVGVIVDKEDERYVSDEENKKLMCRAIVSSIKYYLDNSVANTQPIAPGDTPQALRL